jgi:tRNA(His) 5'-end guanylyltransferase
MGSLGDRMKSYERVTRTNLMRRTPVVIRLDGKAFHTYTHGMEKPFSQTLSDVRKETLDYLCNSVQGCVLGYSQSDELSLVLKDWNKFNTSAWFDNNIQKITSISASMCTMKFNKLMTSKGYDKEALFDSRVFNLPIEEVPNYLIWRQQDWERNSVQMLARSKYSQKECHKKSCKNLITMLEEDYNIVWGNIPVHQKQGEIWFEGKIQEDFIFKDNRERLLEMLKHKEES